MIVRKYTTGYVCQEFDTETGNLISQNFRAGDPVEFEDEDGNELDVFESEVLLTLYAPFDMVQPSEAYPDGKGQ